MMSKKISRRNFLAGASKITAALAAIWVIDPVFVNTEPETPGPESEAETCTDCGSGPCHPYYAVGGVQFVPKLPDDWILPKQ